jgi:hypothetical protein
VIYIADTVGKKGSDCLAILVYSRSLSIVNQRRCANSEARVHVNHKDDSRQPAREVCEGHIEASLGSLV